MSDTLNRDRRFAAEDVGPGRVETRTTTLDDIRVEARADGDDGERRIVGYAAVFNQPTRIRGWFSSWDEQVKDGAFTKTLKESKRIVSTFNHDEGRLLGATDAGTVTFTEDDVGLKYDIDINPNDPLAVSVWEQVDRGDVRGSSIWFRVVREEWDESEDLEVPKRTIFETQLFEGGPVVFPAFDTTTAGTRNLRVVDAVLRAAGTPEKTRAALTVDALTDPERFEDELRRLLSDRPTLRDAVCACDARYDADDGHLPAERERRLLRARGLAAFHGLPLGGGE